MKWITLQNLSERLEIMEAIVYHATGISMHLEHQYGITANGFVKSDDKHSFDWAMENLRYFRKMKVPVIVAGDLTLIRKTSPPLYNYILESKEKSNTADAPFGNNNGINNCPFCGGKEGQDVFLGRLSDVPKFKICCIPCGVTLIDDRKDKVIANWNRRTGTTADAPIEGSLEQRAKEYANGRIKGSKEIVQDSADNINDEIKDAYLAATAAETSDLLEWVVLFYGTIKELVELKLLKDAEGKTENYLERQPKAWYLANKAIALWSKSDYGALPFSGASSSQLGGDGEYEMKRLYEWLIDENRKPAQTFFTAGWLRNVAKEIQFRLAAQSTPTPPDYIEVIEDHKRLVRELDEIINGKSGMAKQASLCDLVAQLKKEYRPTPPGIVDKLRESIPRFHELQAESTDVWNECCDTLATLLSEGEKGEKKENLKGEAKFDEKTGNATYPDKVHWGEMKKGWEGLDDNK